MKPEKITELREKRGLTKEALAQMLGVSPNTIRYWEKGISEPKPENEHKLEKALTREVKDE